MRPPPALLFDLDGTLVDSAVTIAAALTELAAARGAPSVSVAQARRLVGRGAPVLVREALGHHCHDVDSDVVAFREILAATSCDPEMIFPGVIDSLASLTQLGHPCAVVTNKPERLAVQLLEQLNMACFFGAVVGGDTLSACKPDPAPLRHAAATMRTSGAVLMIGDSDIDATAARAAGMPFVLYEAGYEADRVEGEMAAASFTRFDALAGVVQALTVGP